jgi:hypothetical protein
MTAAASDRQAGAAFRFGAGKMGQTAGFLTREAGEGDRPEDGGGGGFNPSGGR